MENSNVGFAGIIASNKSVDVLELGAMYSYTKYKKHKLDWYCHEHRLKTDSRLYAADEIPKSLKDHVANQTLIISIRFVMIIGNSTKKLFQLFFLPLTLVFFY
ncbi:hypothetical protein B0681_09920 [Moraxella porci DSM 25326]|uniref:Uncharacterized protein n=1 Tax=Moraxella porci DSM 25326 TaxID=573983 RepID=A0A1T0CLG8_9GAMM|nr:hypothetical protein B0681_09920 [Moraxella porci DSM 25326]